MMRAIEVACRSFRGGRGGPELAFPGSPTPCVRLVLSSASFCTQAAAQWNFAAQSSGRREIDDLHSDPPVDAVRGRARSIAVQRPSCCRTAVPLFDFVVNVSACSDCFVGGRLSCASPGFNALAVAQGSSGRFFQGSIFPSPAIRCVGPSRCARARRAPGT